MLDSIKIILCQTSHPGNIGAAARAMKTMGLEYLVLVSPKQYPCAEATARASGATDILANTRVVDSLAEAIADCRLVIGTSARGRTLPWPLLTPRDMVGEINDSPEARPVAIVFGREDSGLTNEELALCHLHVSIPSNPDYSSLNLASAVQILAYELRIGAGAGLQLRKGAKQWRDSELPATGEQFEGFYGHLEQVITEIGYYDPERPKHLPIRLRRLFQRARLTLSEINILRGILNAVQKKLS